LAAGRDGGFGERGEVLTREHNWADNHTFTATRIHRPASVAELCHIVARAPRVRAIGARHSFNGVADSPGELIDLGGINPDFVIDREGRTVTLGGGASYAVLAAYLQREGRALHNMASLPHVTVAGATATGTHGSGDGLGNLATAVAGLEIVTATGEMAKVRRGDENFDGMVVGLGAFGIVTRITLDIQQSYEMRQDAFEGLAWDRVLADLDAVMAAGYSVSLATMWSGPAVTRLWIKTRLAEGGPRAVSAAYLGAKPASEPLANRAPDALRRLNPFGAPGPWSERLPHFRPDEEPALEPHLQSEYMVPRARAAEAMTLLRAIGHRIDPHLLTTEIRSMAADRLWLSPGYGADSIGIHFSWKKEPDAVDRMTAEIEELLLPLGARPHWGKIMHAPAQRLAPLYPKLPAFRDLARSFDPAGKFRNEFLDTHVFG
jgi:alditol oxidase